MRPLAPGARREGRNERDRSEWNRDEANLSVSAGSLTVALSGRQPSDIELDVSSGSARVTVPEGEYDVTSDVSAGNLDNGLGSTPGADSTIRVQVSAGQAVLRAG